MSNLFASENKASRLQYVMAYLFSLLAITILYSNIMRILEFTKSKLEFNILFYGILFIIGISLLLFMVWRLNDMGKSRWYILFAFIPIVNTIFGIVLCFYPPKKLLNQNKTNDYVGELANYLMQLKWAKDKSRAIAFADTLILNMGFIEAKDYITDANNRYSNTLIKVFAIIQATAEGNDSITKDVYYAVAQVLHSGLDEMMSNLTESVEDIVELTFIWGNVKNDFSTAIKNIYTDLQEENYDEMSEKLMEYLSFSIQAKNGYSLN